MRKNWKENHATKVTKTPETNRRKYGMNEIIVRIIVKSDFILFSIFFQEHIDFPVTNATIGYLIARPKNQAHKSPKRVCLIYTNLNDTYFWTVDPTSCPRKIKPGVAGIFKFNTTKIGNQKTWG